LNNVESAKALLEAGADPNHADPVITWAIPNNLVWFAAIV
jgi:hypothetical protein